MKILKKISELLFIATNRILFFPKFLKGLKTNPDETGQIVLAKISKKQLTQWEKDMIKFDYDLSRLPIKKIIDTEILARTLLLKYKLKDWKFEWDNAKDRLGCCNYSKKVITVSRYALYPYNRKEVKDTILHEIAHALVGFEEAHSPIWKEMAKKIGATPSRCGNIIPKVPLKPYKGTCGCQNRIIYSASSNRNYLKCTRCNKHFVWVRNTFHDRIVAKTKKEFKCHEIIQEVLNGKKLKKPKKPPDRK